MAGRVAVLVLLVTAVLGQNMQTWDHKYERLGQYEAAAPDSVTLLQARRTVLLYMIFDSRVYIFIISTNFKIDVE